ncbi:hypothetical protein SCHPADRAFT_933194 [Schizopora paradoxa]|uniref:Uncharacterized protein n=1 Tax=Schizopora paradoxa TaxID=27342 RepID=A0A0H2R9P5_9AGAM|nr:hypothetical protein SCHPADRAFT_933194 [Schizopora paradoxa]
MDPFEGGTGWGQRRRGRTGSGRAGRRRLRRRGVRTARVPDRDTRCPVPVDGRDTIKRAIQRDVLLKRQREISQIRARSVVVVDPPRLVQRLTSSFVPWLGQTSRPLTVNRPLNERESTTRGEEQDMPVFLHETRQSLNTIIGIQRSVVDCYTKHEVGLASARTTINDLYQSRHKLENKISCLKTAKRNFQRRAIRNDGFIHCENKLQSQIKYKKNGRGGADEWTEQTDGNSNMFEAKPHVRINTNRDQSCRNWWLLRWSIRARDGPWAERSAPPAN